MPKKIFLLALPFCMAVKFGTAQQKWNLRTIVDYAMANNIGVKLSDVQAKVSALIYNQNKLSQYPSLSFSGNTGLNSGSNQDPTSFSRITQTYLSAGLQLQSSAEIFNFYSKRNIIAASQWELQASKANVEKSKNDIALNAANAYLQILLALQQQEIASVQVQQTQAQLSNTQKLVKAGSLPELNASQLEAQLATDSVSYITAKGNVTQAILSLKTYMSIPADVPFDVDTPPIESIPIEPIAEMQPADVYRLALANQPQQVYDSFKIKAAEKSADAAKGAMYPTFSLYGSLGSNYNNQSQIVTGGTQSISTVPGATVNVGGTSYNVYSYQFKPDFKNRNFPNQLSDNFRQAFGLSVNVPIFNGGSLRTNWERSKLDISSLQLQKKLDDQTLKQNIYSAYNAAVIALEKFNASEKSVISNQQTYDFANKRFTIGMLGTYDLLTTQNNLLRSKLEYTLNQFDYVFKMKVLEYYKGLGLKL
ncbi:MAG: TolC family protein [Ferruginibacter sp.]